MAQDFAWVSDPMVEEGKEDRPSFHLADRDTQGFQGKVE